MKKAFVSCEQTIPPFLAKKRKPPFWKAAVWQESGLTVFRNCLADFQKELCGNLASAYHRPRIRSGRWLPSGALVGWSSPLQW